MMFRGPRIYDPMNEYDFFTSRIDLGFQVRIPPAIAEHLKLWVGQEVDLHVEDGVITLIPVRRLEELRGIAKGIDTENLRDKKDRY